MLHVWGTILNLSLLVLFSYFGMGRCLSQNKISGIGYWKFGLWIQSFNFQTLRPIVSVIIGPSVVSKVGPDLSVLLLVLYLFKAQHQKTQKDKKKKKGKPNTKTGGDSMRKNGTRDVNYCIVVFHQSKLLCGGPVIVLWNSRASNNLAILFLKEYKKLFLKSK